MSKPIDYDAPRRPSGEADDGVAELKPRGAAAQSPRVDLDETEAAEIYEFAGRGHVR